MEPPRQPVAAPLERAEVPALAAFEQRQRQLAAQAAAQGHWVDAQIAWDVVLALKPRDEEAQARWREAVAAAQAGVAERLPKARLARQRGELEGAMHLYLEVLALDPAQAEAGDALRALEVERVRRVRRPGAASTHPEAGQRAPAAIEPAPGTVPDEVEHATMLARQGEVEAAIALLQPAASQRRADPTVRALMADLYFQQAERLAPTDPVTAIAALERSLRFAPAHPQARALLRKLQPSGNPATPPRP